MSLITVGGIDALRGRLHMPSRGGLWSEWELDTATALATPGAAAIVAVSGINITATVIRSGVDAARAKTFARVVGGGGGLTALVPPATFRSAQLRDPLGYVLSTAGETLSPTVSSSILGASLASWSIPRTHAAQAIDALCFAAEVVLGVAPINWRFLADGTLWLGTENWPQVTLPRGSDVLDVMPLGPRYVIGCETPTLMPGVFLTDVGQNVTGIDHWLEPDSVRTWAWT